ncbi:MAG: glycosyltransferase [Kiritimatiellae bacterium]|nr:glycosyltransferase [Kiritimatiellia bacterium]
MKILHIYKDYFPVLGGIENHVRVVAESQAQAGHNVTVLTCSPGRATHETLAGGVRIVWAGRLATLRSMPISPALPRLVRHERPDVVHLHTPFPLGELAILRLPSDQPVVVTHHADIVRQRLLARLLAPLLRRSLRRVQRIVVTSEAYARGSPWLRPHAGKWRVVPLGTDTTCFSPDGPVAADAAELLFVGRLRYYKGLDTLFDALLQLPGVRLDIVGDGRMAAAWRARSEALGLSDRVRFLGDRPDAELGARYRGAKLFVLPANCRAEAFGTVLIEAMACGLPCVTTDIGTGTSWVVQDGECGRVVPPSQPEPLAAAIRAALADAPLRLAWSKAARQRVEQHFTVERMLAGIEGVYREIVTPATVAKSA